MTMRIFIPRAGCGCGPSTPVSQYPGICCSCPDLNSCLFNAAPEHREKAERLNWTQYDSGTTTSPGQSVVRERERESTIAWFYCDQRHQLIKTERQLEQILQDGPVLLRQISPEQTFTVLEENMSCAGWLVVWSWCGMLLSVWWTK